MQVDLYASVQAYARVQEVLAHLLRRGEAFAAAKGASEDEWLGWRLAPDMFDLREQAMSIIYFGPQWVARVADLPLPPTLEGKPSLAELHAGIGRSKAFLAGITREQVAGRDDVAATVELGAMSPTMPLGQWITGFATPNVYFHLSMAYAILRHEGLDLSKRDLFAGGF